MIIGLEGLKEVYKMDEISIAEATEAGVKSNEECAG